MNQVEVRRRQIQLASYMPGLISVLILGRKIGDNGIAYLAVALEGFYLIWCLTGANLSDTLGRMLRVKNAKGQYKNAAKMRRNILILQCFVGIFGSILFLCLTGLFTEKLFRMSYSKYIMMILTPVILLRTISAVILGYFQGKGSELPTVISLVMRQLLYLGLGLLFSSRLSEYGGKVSALLGQEAFVSMYGGVGVALAILVTELLILLALLLTYKVIGGTRLKKEAEGMKATDSFGGHCYLLFRNMRGKILLSLLEALPLWVGIIFFQKSVEDIYASAEGYGVYIGKYLILCGFVILFSAVRSTAIYPRIASCVRREEIRFAKNIFQTGLRIVLVYSLFFVVFAAIMAGQLAGIFAVNEGDLLADMLSYGSVLILFVSLAFYFSRLLLLLGKGLLVYACAGAGDLVFIISTVLLLNGGEAGIMALVYAGLIGSGIYALSTGGLVFGQLHTGIDGLRTLAIPAGSACLMGLLCLFLSKIFTPHLGNLVTVVVCLVLGGMLYLLLILFLRCFREQELDAIPGGRVLRALGQILRVL